MRARGAAGVRDAGPGERLRWSASFPPGTGFEAPAPAQRLAPAIPRPSRVWLRYPESEAHVWPRRKWPPASWPPPVSPVYFQVGLGLSAGRHAWSPLACPQVPQPRYDPM